MMAKATNEKSKKTEQFPALQATLWRLDDIVPYHANPRTHPPEQVSLLAKLLVRHGIDQPIVVDEDGIILKGHGRRLAAIEARLPEFPVVQRIGLTDVEKRAMRIEDNQVALLSAWDDTLIRAEIASLQTAGYEITLLGFGDVDLVNFTTMPGPSEPGRQASIGNLADRFGVVPFSVLNAREGWWQDRKRGWLKLGIRSELGRGENLIKRSLQDRCALILAGWHYSKVRKFVEDKRREGFDDDKIESLARETIGEKRKGRLTAIPGGAGKNSIYRDSGRSARKRAKSSEATA